MLEFSKDSFETGLIKFSVPLKPVSMQNKGRVKSAFKNEFQKLTSHSKFIITDTCWVAIDYYCHHVKREKNPSVYDIDNIIKPILDALVGKDGLLIDDVIVNRVTVNWVDTHRDDYFEVEIEYPDLSYVKKDDLVFLKSESGWCFPTCQQLLDSQVYLDMMKNYFEVWDSIGSEEEYYGNVYNLPIQNFIYFVKIRDKGFEFIELNQLTHMSRLPVNRQ